jgi:hypothetical protein
MRMSYEYELEQKRKYNREKALRDRIKERYTPYTRDSLALEIWNNTYRELTDRDLDAYVVKKCFSCTAGCEQCKFRDLSKEIVDKRFEQYVYRNIKQLGNCYYDAKKLSDMQLTDLEYFCECKIGYKPCRKISGIIIYAIK